MTRTIGAARAEEASVGRLIAGHLGAGETAPAVAKASFPSYDRVNVQTGLEAWLAEPGRSFRLLGLVEYRHRDLTLPDLLQSRRHGPFAGSVETEAVPAGPGGVTLPCVQIGLYLVNDDDGPAVILLRGPEEHGSDEVFLEAGCASADGASSDGAGSDGASSDRAGRIVAAIR